MINVRIDLIETSQCLTYEALNTYTKGPFYCVYKTDGVVVKHPLSTIWRVTEEYGESSNRKSK